MKCQKNTDKGELINNTSVTKSDLSDESLSLGVESHLRHSHNVNVVILSEKSFCTLFKFMAKYDRCKDDRCTMRL